MIMTAVPNTNTNTARSENEVAITNPKMEQFLWLLNIRFKRTFRSPDGMTTWVYQKTPTMDYAMRNFLSIQDHIRSTASAS